MEYISVVWEIKYAHTDISNQLIITSTGEGAGYRFSYLFYGRVSGYVYAPFILRNKELSDGKVPITTENAVWFPAYMMWDSNVCMWNSSADGIVLGSVPLGCGWGWTKDGMMEVRWGDRDGLISVREAHILGVYAAYLKTGVEGQLLLSRSSEIPEELYL